MEDHVRVQAGQDTLQHTAPTPCCSPRPHPTVLRAMLRVTHNIDKCQLGTGRASAVHTLANSKIH
jgi:hypothetical protein